MFKRIIILSCLTLITKQGFAEPVEPVFSGTWYSEISYRGNDNCNMKIYDYSNQNSDPDVVAENYMKTLPTTSGCVWSISSKTDNPNGLRPDDFPGSYDMYQQVLTENEPATMLYGFVCRLGKNNQDNDSLYVYPNYICPTGSRNSFDRKASYFGCTNKPQLCTGDIVTRNLNVPGLGSAGHSGATFGGNLILNVLPIHPLTKKPSTDVFALTYFVDFYNTSQYWGDEYGVPSQPTLSQDQGENILNSAFHNLWFNALYTYFTEFTPAESFVPAYTFNAINKNFQKIIINKTEKWRCDTFADWVYYKGTGKMPLSFVADSNDSGSYKYTNSTDLPVDLYANLINTRDNGLDGQINANTEMNVTKDDEQEQALFNYAAKLSAVVKNTRITRDEQLQTLVQLLNEQPDDEHYGIVADALASLHPIEKTDLILQQYNTDDSVSKKEWILYMLENAAEINNPINQDNNIIKIQEFLNKKITEETNPIVLESIIHAYNNIMPYSQDKVNTVKQALTQIPETPEYINNKMLERFTLAINSPDSKPMAQLIQNMQASDQATLFQYFISSAIINGLPLNLVSSQTKMDLNVYIQTRLKNDRPVQSNLSRQKSEIAYPEYYKLIKAYGLLNNNEKASSNYIMSLNDTFLQAKMVSFAYFDKQNPSFFKNLNSDELLLSYQEIVKNFPTMGKAKSDIYDTYISAIAVLDGSYSRYMQKQVEAYKRKKIINEQSNKN